MKKYKICLLLLVCFAFILSGCAGEKYLKTASTNLSLATFYENNYISSFSEFDGVENDDAIISNESDRIAYKNYISTYKQILPEERCIVSAVDYLTAVNQGEGEQRVDNVTKTKIYEYSTIYKQELLVSNKTASLANDANDIKAVIVTKSAKNDAEITAYLFYKYKTDKSEISTLLSELENAHYTFIFTLNKHVIQTKTYTLVYGQNGSKTGCETVVSFNEAKGCLNFSIKTFMGVNNTLTNFEKSIYKYSNYDVGVRAIAKYKENSKSTTIVYEQLSKDFYKKLKLGEVKDESNMLSMETMQEDKLAKPNNSDLLGFELEHDLQNDEEENKITCLKYGNAE